MLRRGKNRTGAGNPMLHHAWIVCSSECVIDQIRIFSLTRRAARPRLGQLSFQVRGRDLPPLRRSAPKGQTALRIASRISQVSRTRTCEIL
jgi:hypothetical protein